MADTDQDSHRADAVGDFTVSPPGYRLPAELELGPVVLQVADLERSMAYYGRVLGLGALRQGAGRAALGPAAGDRVLVELRELRGATPVPRRGRLGLYHFALLLPDRASLGRFVSHLAALGERAGSADHLVSEALYLTDPDGLGIEVYADRPRSAWPVRGRTLAMATDPLDLDGLVGAGGGQPWRGAPEGTRMGHLHLYVDDLERGADFYHRGLGLDRIVLAFPGALFMSAGGYHHHLGTNVWAAGAPAAGPGDARLLEWTLRVPRASDLEAVSRSVAAAGYTVGRDSASVTASDPWGTQVRIEVAPPLSP